MNWYLEVLRKYAVFDGRARRMEYWIFFLSNLIIVSALRFAATLAGIPDLIGLLYALGVLVPGIAVGVRRLHDTDRSGWWLLIAFVPFVGAVALLVFMAQDSAPGENRYGTSPKEEAS